VPILPFFSTLCAIKDAIVLSELRCRHQTCKKKWFFSLMQGSSSMMSQLLLSLILAIVLQVLAKVAQAVLAPNGEPFAA
jgi:hypothetical protein